MIKFGNNNIGKIYLGSNLIGKAYFGSNLVYQSGGQPQPTTEVPYIRNTIGAYIDTGITADSTTRVIVLARNFNPGGGFLFGSRTSTSAGKFVLASFSGSNGIDFGRFRNDFNTQSLYTNSQYFNYLGGYHKYELDKNVLKIDDTTIQTASSGTFSNNYNIYLFACNTGGTASLPDRPVDICSVRIFKGETLVRNLTPVQTPSVGFYDSVSGATFTNSGSGSLSYGTFYSDAYTPLEYISTTGLQYIDSGIAGGYGTKMIMRLKATGSTARWYVPIGARYTTQRRCEFFYGTSTKNLSNINAGYITTTNQMKSNSTNYFKDMLLTLYKENNVFNVINTSNTRLCYYTGSSDSSYVSGSNVMIGGVMDYDASPAAFAANEAFIGDIYYVGVNNDRSFVPALVNNVAGLYDTYNDVFYPSNTSTNFVAGPTL